MACGSSPRCHFEGLEWKEKRKKSRKGSARSEYTRDVLLAAVSASTRDQWRVRNRSNAHDTRGILLFDEGFHRITVGYTSTYEFTGKGSLIVRSTQHPGCKEQRDTRERSFLGRWNVFTKWWERNRGWHANDVAGRVFRMTGIAIDVVMAAYRAGRATTHDLMTRRARRRVTDKRGQRVGEKSPLKWRRKSLRRGKGRKTSDKKHAARGETRWSCRMYSI